MKARTAFKNYIKKYGSEYQNIQTVRLGNLAGTVTTGTNGVLWARQWNGKVIKVINRALVPPDFDLRVLVGITRTQPSKWYIIDVMEDYLTPASGGRIDYHHTQHEFLQPDMVMLDRRQIYQLSVLVSDGANFKVQLYGGLFLTRTSIVQVASTVLDMSPYRGYGAYFVGIEVDEAGDVSCHVGTNFWEVAQADYSYVPLPDPGKIVIAYVMLYEGQTELTNDHIGMIMPTPYRPFSVSTDLAAAPEDANPLSADRFLYLDDAELEALKYITWADLQAQMRAALDALYNAADHTHAIMRWVSAGGTAFELPDVAEMVLQVTDNGSTVDPLVYTLTTNNTRVTFDAAVTAGHVIVAQYIPRKTS